MNVSDWDLHIEHTGTFPHLFAFEAELARVFAPVQLAVTGIGKRRITCDSADQRDRMVAWITMNYPEVTIR